MEHKSTLQQHAKEFQKLYQGTRSTINYFSGVSQICTVLNKLSPKDYVTDLTFPLDSIIEAVGAAADVNIQHSVVNLMLNTNKQA